MSRFGYDLFLFGERMPITPETVQTTVEGRNETMSLINDGEINFMKRPGLTDVSFQLRLPHKDNMAVASYSSGFHPPEYFLNLLQTAMENRETTDFILSRGLSVNGEWFGTHLKVSVEGIPIDESNILFLAVDVKLKLYKDFGTKRLTITQPAPSAAPKKPTVKTEKTRPAKTPPKSIKAGSNETAQSASKKFTGTSATGHLVYDSKSGKMNFEAGRLDPKISSTPLAPGKTVPPHTRVTLRGKEDVSGQIKRVIK